MHNQIREIEINTTNICTANCYLCDKCRGNGNIDLMTDEVFEALFKQLHQVDFDQIQTSGNGDALLHPKWLGWVRRLRQEFPDKEMNFYSSFYSVTSEIADIFAEEGIFNEIYTRIDSMDSGIQTMTTGVDGGRIFDNLEYFIKRARPKTKLFIGYSSIPQYYKRCEELFGCSPLHNLFPNSISSMQEQFLSLMKWVTDFKVGGYTKVNKINQSLWAERHNPGIPVDKEYLCPKLSRHLLDNIMWICPDGRVDICGYDDSQDIFTYGNILDDHMLDIWHSKERQELLECIRNRNWIEYPCNNPKCCEMYSQGG